MKLKILLGATLLSINSLAFINGGTPVIEGELIARSTVAIGNQDRFHCSASILSDQILLTAAHCIEGLLVDTVYFGLNANIPNETRIATAVFGHPDFERRSSREGLSDIALVRFEGGLPEGYTPATLLSSDYEIQIGDTAILAGFGRSNESGVGILRKIARPVLAPVIFESEIQFEQSENEGACFGDSGGPAYVETSQGLMLTGVASRVGNANCGIYSIYTRPQDHLDFIISAADQLLNESSEEFRLAATN